MFEMIVEETKTTDVELGHVETIGDNRIGNECTWDNRTVADWSDALVPLKR